MAMIPVRHVKRYRSGGRWHAYHRITKEPLADPAEEQTPEWLETVAARAAEINARLTGKRAMSKRPGTWDDLCARFLASPEYAGLAEGTKIHYRRDIDFIREKWGTLPVRDVKTKHVLAIRDTKAETPRAADKLLATLSRLFAYGRLADGDLFGDANPALSIPKLHSGGDGYPPWPAEVIEVFCAWAYPELQHAVLGILYTGQRPGDVVSMVWTNYDGETITVRQQKTYKRKRIALAIPVHPVLKAILDGKKGKKGAVIFATATGRPWKTAWLSREVARGMQAIDQEGYTPHGLRKNAVNALLEAGATEAETASITNHSLAMVEHYARQVNQRRLAKAAMLQLLKAEEGASGTNGTETETVYAGGSSV